MVEEAPADIPSLLELKRIYYELMISNGLVAELDSMVKLAEKCSISTD